MKTCPDILHFRETTSPAECKVFDLLTKVDLGPDWYAFHSLNCSEHEYKRWSELDFVLAGPDGVFVLEVKGGRIRRDGGTWYYKDRFDKEHRNNEGPFNQAQSGMYSMKRMLDDYGMVQTLERGVVFGWGVVFPDVRWDEDTIETPSRVVADVRCQSVDGMKRYLRGLIEYWRAKERTLTRINREVLDELRRRMRPDIDLVPPLSARLGEVLTRFQTLTDEQDERLRFIEGNQRVIVSGGAGTGKTYLAMQCARRETLRGKSVLLVVESPELAAWLRKSEPDRAIVLSTCRDLESVDGSFDVLIVDEGQDMLDLELLDRLATKVEGGLDDGRWRWFMDDANQAGLRGSFDTEALEILEKGLGTGVPTRLPLNNNIRNTRQIVDAVCAWTSVDIGSPSDGGTGQDPTVLGVPRAEDAGETFVAILDELTDEGLELDQIALIHPRDRVPAFLDRLPRRIRTRMIPLDPTTARGTLRGKLLWGSVERFKGLERPVVVCTGFEDLPLEGTELAEFYVATTRANFGLYLIVPDDAAPRIRRAMSRTSSSGSTP